MDTYKSMAWRLGFGGARPRNHFDFFSSFHLRGFSLRITRWDAHAVHAPGSLVHRTVHARAAGLRGAASLDPRSSS